MHGFSWPLQDVAATWALGFDRAGSCFMKWMHRWCMICILLIVQIWICPSSPMTVTLCYLGGFNARRALGFLSISSGLVMWFINQLRQI